MYRRSILNRWSREGQSPEAGVCLMYLRKARKLQAVKEGSRRGRPGGLCHPHDCDVEISRLPSIDGAVFNTTYSLNLFPHLSAVFVGPVGISAGHSAWHIIAIGCYQLYTTRP
jgi:hypothetical protein